MKKINLKYYVLTLLFSTVLGISSLFANKKPPMPKESRGFDDSYPVGGPIDNYIPLLFVGAILLGMWAIKKYKMQKI